MYGRLPRGCELCQRGLKSVVFLTGLCPARCFYCPLSKARRSRDVFYVNERKIDVDLPRKALRAAVLNEVYTSASLGAGITGGDPLEKMDRTVWIIRTLKESFGDDFHIHLYTSALTLDEQKMRLLARAGLDEIRLHTPLSLLPEKLRIALRYEGEVDVGLEYPVLPNGGETLKKIISLAAEMGASFINLNELEFTETNSAALRRAGFRLAEDYRTAEGSRETALDVLGWAAETGVPITVHFCPASFKDYYQTGLRHYRRGQVSALPHHMVTDDGTLLELTGVERGLFKGIYPEGRAHIASGISRGRLVEKEATYRGLKLTEEEIGEKNI